MRARPHVPRAHIPHHRSCPHKPSRPARQRVRDPAGVAATQSAWSWHADSPAHSLVYKRADTAPVDTDCSSASAASATCVAVHKIVIQTDEANPKFKAVAYVGTAAFVLKDTHSCSDSAFVTETTCTAGSGTWGDAVPYVIQPSKLHFDVIVGNGFLQTGSGEDCEAGCRVAFNTIMQSKSSSVSYRDCGCGVNGNRPGVCASCASLTDETDCAATDGCAWADAACSRTATEPSDCGTLDKTNCCGSPATGCSWQLEQPRFGQCSMPAGVSWARYVQTGDDLATATAAGTAHTELGAEQLVPTGGGGFAGWYSHVATSAVNPAVVYWDPGLGSDGPEDGEVTADDMFGNHKGGAVSTPAASALSALLVLVPLALL